VTRSPYKAISQFFSHPTSFKKFLDGDKFYKFVKEKEKFEYFSKSLGEFTAIILENNVRENIR
jgi:hypothetical protein